MKKNMSSTDRVIRIAVAVLFASLFLSHVIVGIAGIVLISFAAVMLITSVVGFCPLYRILGINTCRSKVQ
jgi:hypothetical protein